MEWLDTHAGSVQAIATLVLVALAAYYAWASRALVPEADPAQTAHRAGAAAGAPRPAQRDPDPPAGPLPRARRSVRDRRRAGRAVRPRRDAPVDRRGGAHAVRDRAVDAGRRLGRLGGDRRQLSEAAL